MIGLKGQTVGSFIIALLFLGVITQFGVVYVGELQSQYNTSVDKSRIDRYNTIERGTNMSRDLVDTIVGKEADKQLSFINLPFNVWSSLKTIITGVVSAPLVLHGLLTSASVEIGLPDWVTSVIIASVSITLILSIASGVLRSELI